MAFPSIKSSYKYIWWLGLLRVLQALKVIILPLPLRAGVISCPSLIFKPSLGRREKLPQKVGRREKLAEKVGRREIYRSVRPPSQTNFRATEIQACTQTIFFFYSKIDEHATTVNGATYTELTNRTTIA